MAKFSQAWTFNEHNISKILNGFSVKVEQDKTSVFFDNTCISEVNKSDKTLYIQYDGFRDLLMNIKTCGIKPSFVVFTMKDGHYEFKFIGKQVVVMGQNFLEYVSLTDSIDGTLSLQLNFGLIHQETDSVVVVDYNNPCASNRWRHGKVTFKTKTENIHDALKTFKNTIERTLSTLSRLENKKVSYKSVVNKLAEYDSSGNLKLANRQKIIYLNRKVRLESGIKDTNTLNSLRTPEIFIKSNIDVNVSAQLIYLYYIDSFKEQYSNAIVRENNRILSILFSIFEENSIRNKKEYVFSQKTGINFEKFYNEHFNKLSYFLSKYTKDVEIAQDFANEAFIHGLEKIDTYSPEKSKIHTWMYKIAINMVRKNYKDEQKLSVVSFDNTKKDDMNMLNILTDKDNDTDNHKIVERKANIIKDAIYNLPNKYEKYKKVLIMRELDNMQYQEISDTTGVNLSTIKSQISKGREIVAKRVQKQIDVIDKEMVD